MRRTVNNRISLDYIANFNETENVEVTNNHRVNLGWDMFLTNRFFINPIYGEYFRDPFQNIDARNTVGVGAGYQIFDSPKTEWEVSGGPPTRKPGLRLFRRGKRNRKVPRPW